MVAGLNKILDYFQKERHRRSDKEQEALERLHEAVHQTTRYIKSGENDSDREMELSSLWGQAAIAARNISKELARKCYIKRGYWTDPDEWTYEKIRETGISLDQIGQELETLIG